MTEKFNAGARRTLVLAQEEARLLNHHHIGTEHILLGLIHEGESVATTALESLGISLEALRQQVEESIGRGQQAPSGPIPFTPRAKKVLELALREALQLGHSYIGTEHILLGLIREGESVTAQVLVKLGADLNRVRRQVMELLAGRAPSTGEPVAVGAPPRSWPLLDQCGRDLTAAARQSRLDPVVGRDKEIERVVQILARRHRNVPMLVGEPGVGKTAVAFGLARSIAAGDVPSVLQHQTVRSLDLGALLADPQYRGRGTDLLTELLGEVRSHGDLVLFLGGALSPLHLSDGTTNALTLFRSLLGTPGVLFVGSCTTLEFGRRGLEPAIDRSIQAVPVAEPAADDVLEILKSVRGRLEEHHRVSLTDEALKAAASLARDHVPDQRLPGSAIDLLDEASAQVRVREARTDEQRAHAAVQQYAAQIAEVRQAKEEAIDQQDFERAMTLRVREKALIAERRHAEQSAREPADDLPLEITEADVVNALAVYSGTHSPEPPRATPRARQVRPAQPVEHDPYVWSMS
ncbi:Clp protease N-terminal domain-containing protein [Streptomyces cyaneogriseus]|uniref:Clp protease N-terminal domain-containing protein n=1 Tax=Streptomyces cyaneogriseus TaxID=68192 RepID=UPI00069BD2CC|nr:Clp protease N-terminal domain-containing protein [Streptomyces cyaneogriseus]